MKCPKCGKEIPDEALFCEFCGAEIRIVPEYEPGVEEQIDSGMEAVKQTLDEETSPDGAKGSAGGAESSEAVLEQLARSEAERKAEKEEREARKEQKAEERQAKYARRRRHVKLAVFAIFCSVCAVFAGVFAYIFMGSRETGTQSWYVGRAYQMASEGRYQDAADEIDKAIALTEGHVSRNDDGNTDSSAGITDESGRTQDGSHRQGFLVESISASAGTAPEPAPGSTEENEDNNHEDETDATLYLLKAEYLQKAGEPDLALGAASNALESSQSTEDDKIAAYGRMISIYASQEQYAEIAKLLANCSYPSVVQSYLQYTLFDPMFSEEEGSYEGTLKLELSDEGDGSIFYTLDGSKPSTSSSLYTEPIQLTEGEYTVSAVYVNHFGLESNVVTRHYTIRSTMPAAPVVKPNSGTYAKQTKITVELPGGTDGTIPEDSGGVYYTTDGSDPGEEDTRYTDGLYIPPGTTTFKFIYISAEGMRSQVVERQYTYKVSTNIGSAEGINYILVALIRRNEVIDTAGTIPGGTARYTFAFHGQKEIDGVQYLIYDESVVDAAGNTALTGRTYAVNALNGVVNLYAGGALTPIG